MKKWVLALLGMVCWLLLINYAALASAAQPECREITYRQIMNEFDCHIQEFDRLDRELAWMRLQEAHGSSPAVLRRAVELISARDRHVRSLARIHDQLDIAHVDIGRSLMGSSTGRCEENDHLYAVQGELPSRTADGLNSAATSGAYIESGILKRGKKANTPAAKTVTNDRGGVDDAGYYRFDVPANRWFERRKRLSYARSLAYKKDLLTMEQVKIAARLGAVTVPALRDAGSFHSRSRVRRHGVRGTAGSHYYRSSVVSGRRRIIQNGVLIY